MSLPPTSRERSSDKKAHIPQINQKRMAYLLFFMIPKDTINVNFDIMTTINVNFNIMTLIN